MFTKGVMSLKRKVWVSSPILYVLAVVMAGMTAASWFWNPIIFFIELGLTLISIAIITVIFVQFKSHVTVAMKSANKVLSGREYQLLQDFTLPVAIVGNEGDIIWVNTAFLMDVGRDSEYRGENILKLIQSKTFQLMIKNLRYSRQKPNMLILSILSMIPIIKTSAKNTNKPVLAL